MLVRDRRVGKKGKKSRTRLLGEEVDPLVAMREPVAVDLEVLLLVEKEVVEEEVAVGLEAPLEGEEETPEAQMIQTQIPSQT